MIETINECISYNYGMLIKAGYKYREKDAKCRKRSFLSFSKNDNDDVSVIVYGKFKVDISDPEWWNNPFADKYKEKFRTEMSNIKKSLSAAEEKKAVNLWKEIAEDWKVNNVIKGALNEKKIINSLGTMKQPAFIKYCDINKCYSQYLSAESCTMSEIEANNVSVTGCDIKSMVIAEGENTIAVIKNCKIKNLSISGSGRFIISDCKIEKIYANGFKSKGETDFSINNCIIDEINEADGIEIKSSDIKYINKSYIYKSIESNINCMKDSGLSVQIGGKVQTLTEKEKTLEIYAAQTLIGKCLLAGIDLAEEKGTVGELELFSGAVLPINYDKNYENVSRLKIIRLSDGKIYTHYNFYDERKFTFDNVEEFLTYAISNILIYFSLKELEALKKICSDKLTSIYANYDTDTIEYKECKYKEQIPFYL